MNRALRAILLGLAVTFALPASAAPTVTPTGPPEQPTKKPLRVGMKLTATRKVVLRGAVLDKGSSVTVVKITKKGGKPVAVNLELKDGHVLRGVSYRKVQANFEETAEE